MKKPFELLADAFHCHLCKEKFARTETQEVEGKGEASYSGQESSQRGFERSFRGVAYDRENNDVLDNRVEGFRETGIPSRMIR